jgi:hypothetical protein
MFVSGSGAISDLTAGQMTVTMTLEQRTPDNTLNTYSSQFNSLPVYSKTYTFTPPTPYAQYVLKEVRAVVSARVPNDHWATVTARMNTASGVPVIAPFDITDDSSGAAYTSGPISITCDNIQGPPLTITVESTGADLSGLANSGIIMWEFYYEEPTTSTFSWSPGDTLSIVAFASLDNVQYVPIALIRHDWSNTPNAEVVKFTDFAIPASFDPGTGFMDLPDLDHVSFRNSIMLYLADFDNVATWNYIRLLPVWHPTEETNNGDVLLSIVANAREL